MTDFDLMQQLAAQRRNQFAQQSQFQAPQGQMVGRHFVAPNVLQQLAAGLRALGGMRGQQLAEQELQDISRQRTEGTQKALADFLRQAQGTQENAPGDGMGPTLPAMAPDMRGAYSALLQAPDQGLRQAGMQGLTQMPQMEAQAAERAAQREFQQQQAALQNQQRMEQLQAQHQMRMDQLAAQNASRQDMLQAQQQFQREMAQMRRAMTSAPSANITMVDTAEGSFLLNNRTGQLQPAINPATGQPLVRAGADPRLQGQIAGARAGATEANRNIVESGMSAGQAIQQAQNNLRLVDELIRHPGLGVSVGAERVLPLRMIPGTSAADFESRLGQIQGASFLQAFESLKGGGAITEIEGQRATQAINRMNASTSEREFKAAADELRTILNQGIQRAERSQQRLQANPPAGVVLSPRSANAPAGAAAPRVLRFDAQGNIVQ